MYLRWQQTRRRHAEEFLLWRQSSRAPKVPGRGYDPLGGCSGDGKVQVLRLALRRRRKLRAPHDKTTRWKMSVAGIRDVVAAATQSRRATWSLFSSRCKPADNQTDEIISTQSRVHLSRGVRNMVGASQAR